LFVIQHILTFFCFIIFVMLHIPSTALYSRVYIYTPIGLYLFERLVRTLRYAYNNVRPGRATLIQESGGVTKVIVHSRQLKKWTPGSFVLLSLPTFGIGQSHPATIASIPSSHEGKLVFLLRAHHGFTSRIHANASLASLHKGSTKPPASETTHLALIDGPYGGKHLDFASFSSILLIAGSTGVTFTLPIILNLAFRAQKQKLPVREVTFVWAIKTSQCIKWISSELQQAADELYKAGIELSVRFFVTADEEFVEESADERDGNTQTDICQRSKSNGEFSCISAATDNAESTQTAGPNSEKLPISEPELNSNEAIKEKSPQQPPAYSTRALVSTIQPGRPDIHGIVSEAQNSSIGELGVAVCGPVGLSTETRRVVAALEVFGKGIYLHAESFGW
jgi:ferric-chelate reductase